MVAIPHNLSLNGTVITGLRSLSYQRRPQRVALDHQGLLHRTANFIGSTAPRVDFSTVALAQVLGILTDLECPMKQLNANGLVAILPEALSTGPGYVQGSTNRRITFAGAEVYATGIEWSDNQDAVLACSAFAYASAGDTDPVTTDTAAAPTPAVSTEAYRLTSCTLNGVALSPESVSITLDAKPENNDRLCRAMGLPHPIRVTRAPESGPVEISATLTAADVLSTIGNGILSLVFKNMTQGGVIGSSTVTIAINGGMALDEGWEGSPGMRRVVVHARYDGVTRPVTVTIA